MNRVMSITNTVINFIYNKQKEMQQCLKRFIPRAPYQAWPENQLLRLKQLVQQKRPQDNQAWRELCLQMHQLGFRRTLKQYKQKGIRFLSNCQKRAIKISPQKYQQILQNLEQGRSMKDLVDLYPQLNMPLKNLSARLIKKFELMKTIIRKVVGVSKLRPFSMQDCPFLRFVRSESGYLPSLVQVARNCEQYKRVEKCRNEQQKARAEQIERFLTNYNSLLTKYTPKFVQFKKQQAKIKAAIKQEIPKYTESSQSIAFKHLSAISEVLQTPAPYFQSFKQCFVAKKPTEIENQNTVPDFQSLMGKPWHLDDLSCFRHFGSLDDEFNNEDQMEFFDSQ